MAPDFEYFVRLQPTAVIGHSLLGLFVFCVPVGLLVLWVYHAYVKRPALALLPGPLRTRVAAAVESTSAAPRRRGVDLAALVLVGATTHIVWDSFTHARRGLVAHIPALSATILQVGGVDIAAYKVLQHGSTVLGLVVLAYAAVRVMRRRATATVAVPELAARVRRVVVTVIAGAALIGAGAAGFAARGDGEFVRQVQLGGARSAVVALAIVSAGLTVYGVVYTTIERRVARRDLLGRNGVGANGAPN